LGGNYFRSELLKEGHKAVGLKTATMAVSFRDHRRIVYRLLARLPPPAGAPGASFSACRFNLPPRPRKAASFRAPQNQSLVRPSEPHCPQRVFALAPAGVVRILLTPVHGKQTGSRISRKKTCFVWIGYPPGGVSTRTVRVPGTVRRRGSAGNLSRCQHWPCRFRKIGGNMLTLRASSIWPLAVFQKFRLGVKIERALLAIRSLFRSKRTPAAQDHGSFQVAAKHGTSGNRF